MPDLVLRNPQADGVTPAKSHGADATGTKDYSGRAKDVVQSDDIGVCRA